MNAKELFPKFEERMEQRFPREWEMVGDTFDYRDMESDKAIEEAFEYIETDRCFMISSYCQTYHYPEALDFFEEWANSSELDTVWGEALEFQKGYDTPEALLEAARKEFDETGPYDRRPLCDAVCEWNGMIIYEMLGLLVVVWDEMKREAE